MGHTLPKGHVWLTDAFEHAWGALEDGEAHFRALNESVPDDAFRQIFGGNWFRAPEAAEQAYDASRVKIDRLMREALATGELRALIRDQHNGEPGELHNRQKWRDVSGFAIFGLRSEVDRVTCPGPDTGGSPVFVSADELELFIAAAKQSTAAQKAASYGASVQSSPIALAPRTTARVMADVTERLETFCRQRAENNLPFNEEEMERIAREAGLQGNVRSTVRSLKEKWRAEPWWPRRGRKPKLP